MPDFNLVLTEGYLEKFLEKHAYFFLRLTLASIAFVIIVVLVWDPEARSGQFWNPSFKVITFAILENFFSVCVVTLIVEITYSRMREYRQEKINVSIAKLASNKFIELRADEIGGHNLNKDGVLAVYQRRNLGDLIEKINKCSQRIYVMNWWDPHLPSLIDSMVNASKREVVINILIQHPGKECHRIQSIDPTDLSMSKAVVKGGIESNINHLKSNWNRFNSKLTNCVLFDTTLAFSLFLIDDIIYIGLFMHGRISTDGHQFIVRADSKLGERALEEFGTVWEKRAAGKVDGSTDLAALLADTSFAGSQPSAAAVTHGIRSLLRRLLRGALSYGSLGNR